MTFLQFVHEHILFSGFIAFWVVLALVNVTKNLSRIGRQKVVHHHHAPGCNGSHEEGPCPKP